MRLLEGLRNVGGAEASWPRPSVRHAPPLAGTRATCQKSRGPTGNRSGNQSRCLFARLIDHGGLQDPAADQRASGMKSICAVLLIPVFLAEFIPPAAGVSPPGKPRLTGCTSPEKETFTCWWEPGLSGGLPTTHSLFYWVDNSQKVKECPDYSTAGHNSCFFGKNNTSIWEIYHIIVVATNSMGNNTSETLLVDVAFIVKPNSPENVSAVVVHEDQDPFLHVWWVKPSGADTSSGWITLLYQLRVKLRDAQEWQEHDAGMQKFFNVFSLLPNKEYMVQVRCKPDHGFWSEWTGSTYVTMPNYVPRERSLWVMISVFSIFIVLVLSWMLNVKRKSVKLCLLPPVPGPKIKGFDKQLLKAGKSEDAFNALVIPGFPPSTDYDDLLVEYMEVYDSEEQEQELEGKDLSEDGLKSSSPSDADSGRGSCDSRTLLLERRGRGEDPQHYSQHGDTSWASTDSNDSQDSPEAPDRPCRTWPVAFSSPQPLHHHPAVKPTYHSVPEILSLTPPRTLQQLHQGEERPGKPPYRHSQSFSSDGRLTSAAVPPSLSLEYVEVQKVDAENLLLLRPLPVPEPEGEDYSRVREVRAGSVLVLQRERSPHPQTDPCKALVLETCCESGEGDTAGSGYVDSSGLVPFQ